MPPSPTANPDLPPPLPPSSSIETFLNLYSSPSPPPLLDLRPLPHSPSPKFATPFNAFCPKHGLFNRLHELPPPRSTPNLPIYFLSSPTDQVFAHEILSNSGYKPIALPLSVLSQLPIPTLPSPRRLWQPSRLVENCFAQVRRLMPDNTVLDVGAGCGRDAAWLAGKGMSVLAVERDDLLVAKAEMLGKRWGGEGNVTAVTRTFGRDRTDDVRWLRENRAGLMVVVRFLRRGVLQVLHEGVKDGGLVVYEHFLEGCERFGGPKKKSQMLQRGELGTVFSKERGFEVVLEREETLTDGRPVIWFVARKRKKSV